MPRALRRRGHLWAARAGIDDALNANVVPPFPSARSLGATIGKPVLTELVRRSAADAKATVASLPPLCPALRLALDSLLSARDQKRFFCDQLLVVVRRHLRKNMRKGTKNGVAMGLIPANLSSCKLDLGHHDYGKCSARSALPVLLLS